MPISLAMRLSIKRLCIGSLIMAVLATNSSLAAAPTKSGERYHVHINRAGKRLYVINQQNELLFDCPIGIGRGGVKSKSSMKDEVTPTGDFFVDIILTEDSEKTAIAPRYRKQYQSNKPFFQQIESSSALAGMFKRMNAMDFNHDGTADNAYGVAYLGLRSDNAVTGPKLRRNAGTIYWYSIALHGTPTADNIGKCNSGGCVHVPKKYLSRLLVDKLLIINSSVTIRDQAPQIKPGLMEQRQPK